MAFGKLLMMVEVGGRGGKGKGVKVSMFPLRPMVARFLVFSVATKREGEGEKEGGECERG